MRFTRLQSLPRLPHKPVRKKPEARKRGPDFEALIDAELVAEVRDTQPPRLCSSSRGMISTKLQGR